MTRRRSLLLFVVLALSLTGVTRNGVRAVAPSLPDKLSDRDYWSLVSEFSEPDGEFRSDNLLSNEIFLQGVIPDLIRVAKPGRVYLGVGPEQNFTYIAALKPKMAFIVDVRRGNLQLHLMYKALFELSIGSRRLHLPAVLAQASGGPELPIDGRRDLRRALQGGAAEGGSRRPLYQAESQDRAGAPHPRAASALSAEDLKGIEYVYGHFSWYGPGLSYWSTGGRGGGRDAPTYWDLDGGRRRQGAAPKLSRQR